MTENKRVDEAMRDAQEVSRITHHVSGTRTNMSMASIYDASYEDDVMHRTISCIFDDFSVSLSGQRVLVKPNILGPFEVSRGITTHPSVVRAIVNELEKQGAQVIVGDNPGMRGYGSNLLSAKVSGIHQVSNGHYVNLSKSPVNCPVDSPFFDSLIVSKEIMETDYIISVPKFKTHIVTTITGAIKNSFGFLVGGQKSEVHRKAKAHKDFVRAVVDIYRVREPDLIIMDAVVGMQGDGPSSDDLRNIGKIIAGDNAVEVDAVMAIMMGLQPTDVPLLQIASGLGLGETEEGKIEVTGDLDTVSNFKLPSQFTQGAVQVFLARLLTHIMVSQPVLNKNKCTKCGLCMKQCPTQAIQMKPYPTINKAECISCFCCHEFCKNNAIGVKKSVRRYRDMWLKH